MIPERDLRGDGLILVNAGDDLPRAVYGKVAKAALREEFGAESAL